MSIYLSVCGLAFVCVCVFTQKNGSEKNLCVLETVIDCDTLYGERQQARARTDQFCIPLSIKLRSVVNGSRLRCQLDAHSLRLLH